MRKLFPLVCMTMLAIAAVPLAQASWQCIGFGNVQEGPGMDDDEVRNCTGVSDSGDRTCVGANNQWVRENGNFQNDDCQGLRV